ncbi:hypothetical protein ACGFJT_01745 [Actinomadura geliboluensis]|uniref:hypothetical protein n=1 Tax=Actinomadura geliboluensis TaxID=882440 RepID=UPI00370F7F6E
MSDSRPYLCDLVPERALRVVTGYSGPLTSSWDGPQTDNGLCLASGAVDEWPLGVTWEYRNGEKTVRLQERNWADSSPHKIPAELGRGLAVVAPTAGADRRPNFVIAVFKCGEKMPWISIDFARVVRGRDAVQDMFDFMRIAEKRFGQLHKCTPRAS